MKKAPAKKSSSAHSELATATAPPRIKRILVTTDFSTESLAGLRYAAALADRLKSRLAVLNVVEPPSRFAGVDTVILARPDTKVAALARAQLATDAQHEQIGTSKITPSVRIGKAFHEIITAAYEDSADLIVIATHGRTGVEHALLGSTAERVVRHSPCPVLTVPARVPAKGKSKASPAIPGVKKILVPVDFSNLSKEALPYAVLLAEKYQAEMVLIHVVEEFPIDYLLGPELMGETAMPLVKQAESDLARLATNLEAATGVKTSVLVRDGKPFREICLAAKSAGVDLIVLTTHGYTGLKHWWLGSTAERVVRHAACPVLIVREMEHEFMAVSARSKPAVRSKTK